MVYRLYSLWRVGRWTPGLLVDATGCIRGRLGIRLRLSSFGGYGLEALSWLHEGTDVSVVILLGHSTSSWRIHKCWI